MKFYQKVSLTKLFNIVSSKRAAMDAKAEGKGVSIIGFASVGTEAKNGNSGTTTGLLGTWQKKRKSHHRDKNGSKRAKIKQ